MFEVLLKLIITTGLSVAAIDLWQLIFHKLCGLPPTNWRFVGRWLLVLLSERIVFNTSLASTPEVEGEAAAGWLLHYAVGGVYVLIYFVLWQHLNVLPPTLVDGVLFGVLSVVVPWFFFMPALGAGVLARNTPRPLLSCAAALATHSIFGLAIAYLLGVLI